MINGTHDLTHPGGYTLSPELRLPCGHHHCPGKVHFDGTWYSSLYDKSIPQKKAGTFHCQVRYWRVTSFWSHLQANLRDAAAQAEMKAPRMCFHLIATTHLVMLQLMVKHSHKGGNWDILPQYLASCPTMATGWEQPAASRYTVFKCYAVAPVTDPFLPFKATEFAVHAYKVGPVFFSGLVYN